ncbi:cupin domain-containing protein [Zavarzinia compransoris]|uniref:cupin domain-containing protein n=1 Tax=Zavarzinia marina TaxID=2911065 RepID=UPI001F288A4A|nr:cupin domain-containing protein [Zavarzinia marina]MCF4164374.1 cupin domain-containing protein [Zavarzinia marina]
MIPAVVRLGACAGEGVAGAPARVLDGRPTTRLWNEYADAGERLYAGVWSSTEGSWPVDYTEEEVCVILEGRVRLTSDDGAVSDFGPGDAFVIPSGFRGIWASLDPVRKLYVVYEPAAA